MLEELRGTFREFVKEHYPTVRFSDIVQITVRLLADARNLGSRPHPGSAHPTPRVPPPNPNRGS